jgi:hypothetical protein
MGKPRLTDLTDYGVDAIATLKRLQSKNDPCLDALLETIRCTPTLTLLLPCEKQQYQ